MAKPATLQIKLLSTAGTGYFYITTKNPRRGKFFIDLMAIESKAMYSFLLIIVFISLKS